MQWPDGKEFAFSIFDDTDDATVENCKPIYDLLLELGLRTTKSVWIYPPRGRYSGQSLSDLDYRRWVQELQTQGFEIGLHNVGDGAFSREEILQGLELFREYLGHYPRIHTNHVSNPDNIYWLEDRFEWPYRQLYRLYMRLFHSDKPGTLGTQPDSPCFWGDACKQHIDYIRNFTCSGIDTLRFDPAMPYSEERKREYSNKWFSSSNGHSVRSFCDLLHPKSVDQLRADKGACIVYTHFASGFVDRQGRVDPLFRERLTHLASLGGYYAPVSEVLDHLAAQQNPAAPLPRPSVLRWVVDQFLIKARYGRRGFRATSWEEPS